MMSSRTVFRPFVHAFLIGILFYYNSGLVYGKKLTTDRSTNESYFHQDSDIHIDPEEKANSSSLETWFSLKGSLYNPQENGGKSSATVEIHCEAADRLNYFTVENEDNEKFERLITQMATDVYHQNFTEKSNSWRHASLVMEMVLDRRLDRAQILCCVPYCSSFEKDCKDINYEDEGEDRPNISSKMMSLSLDVQTKTVSCKGIEEYFRLDDSFIQVLDENSQLIALASVKRKENGSIVIEGVFPVEMNILRSKVIRCTLYFAGYYEVEAGGWYLFSFGAFPVLFLCCFFCCRLWQIPCHIWGDNDGNERGRGAVWIEGLGESENNREIATVTCRESTEMDTKMVSKTGKPETPPPSYSDTVMTSESLEIDTKMVKNCKGNIKMRVGGSKKGQRFLKMEINRECVISMNETSEPSHLTHQDFNGIRDEISPSASNTMALSTHIGATWNARTANCKVYSMYGGHRIHGKLRRLHT